MMGEATMILEFRGEYAFLSNFYPSEVSLDGIVYPTVEHAYQAAKTLNPTEREMILKLETPGRAKRAGMKVFLREDWEDIKISVMTKLVRQKFTNHGILRDKLLKTNGLVLLEGNNWGDEFWGVNLRDYDGHNHLGNILMKVRKELNG
jgi:ribA/ribD-fused uncharacterized protein